MTRHDEQVVSVLKRAVQDVLTRGLNDPRVRGMVSVTTVTLSRDGQEARVGVSVLPAEHAPLTTIALQHAAGHIHRRVADLTLMRRVPQLVFELDQGIKREAAVYAAINEGARRDEALREGRAGSAAVDSPPEAP
jgi:ribosome-binding factor A